MTRQVITMMAAAVFVGSAVRAKADTEAAAPRVMIDTRLVESLSKHEFGLNWYFQDVRVGTSLFGFMFAPGGSVIGLGATCGGRLNTLSRWSYRVAGGYGIGSAKEEGSIFLDGKTALRSWFARTGLGYVMPITSRTRVHADGALFYSSTAFTFDDGTNKADSKPFKVVGLEESFGGSLDLGSRTSLDGELYSQFGWGSVHDGAVKFNTTVKLDGYRGGLLWHF